MADSKRRLVVIADFLDRVSGPARKARQQLAGVRREAGKTDQAAVKSGSIASGVMQTVLSMPARLVAGALGAIRAMVSSVFRLVTGVAQVGLLLGGLALGALVANLKSVSAEVGNIARRAAAMGVPAKLMLEFGEAAARAGVGSSQLQNALGIANRRLDEVARRGGGRAAQALSVLGVRIKSATGELRPLAELLPEISDGLSRIEDRTLRRDLGRNIFGQSDPLTLGFLSQGSGSLRAAQAEIRAIVGELSEAQIKDVERLDVAFKLFFRSVVGGGRQLTAQLAPFVTEALKKITAAVSALPEIVTNAVRLVRDALRPQSAVGGEAREFLGKLFSSLVETSIVFIEQGFSILLQVAVAAGVSAVGLFFDAIGPAVTNRVKRLINKGVSAGAKALLSSVGEVVLGKELANKAKAILKISRGIIDSNLRAEPIVDSEALSFSFLKSFRGVSGVVVSDRIAESLRAIRENLGGFFDVLNDGIGVVDIFSSKYALLTESFNKGDVGLATKSLSLWQKGLDGVAAAVAGATDQFQGFTNKALTAFTLGKQVGDAMVGTFVNDFPNAVLEGSRSLKEFGEQAKRVLKNLLDAINQVVLRFLALRIVSAIGNAFATTPASQAPVFGPPAPASAPLFGPPNPFKQLSPIGVAGGSGGTSITFSVVQYFTGGSGKGFRQEMAQSAREMAQQAHQMLDTVSRTPSLKSKFQGINGGR